MTASPAQLLLMLYDGAIRFTRQAMAGIENNNLSQTHKGIRNSMAIITEFSITLDHSIGGKIAEDLASLYDYMIRELLLANLHKDKEKLRGVVKLLVDQRATWVEAVEISKQEQAPANGTEILPTIPSRNAPSKVFTHFSISG